MQNGIVRCARSRMIYLLAGAVFLTLSLLCSGNAFGQGVAAPPGSYLQTCFNVQYNSALQTLTATCQITPGNNSTATVSHLNTSNCDPGADIEQLNGWLQCKARAGTWGNGGAVPGGSYQQSCDHNNVQQMTQNGRQYPRLAARCGANGRQNAFSMEVLLDLSQCSMNGDIAYYENGNSLTCAPAPQSASSPVNQAPSAAQPGTCHPGFVWRMANAGDHLCVTVQTRQLVVNENAAASQYTVQRAVHVTGAPDCVKGYVWRQADNTDYVCVTTLARAAVAADNVRAASRTY